MTQTKTIVIRKQSAVGRSAYQIAISKGFVGTEQEWVESLKASSPIQIIAGETIPSHTPIAIVNNIAYKYDASNVAHLWAFGGISKTSATSGVSIEVQQAGIINLSGWNLQSNSIYFSGIGEISLSVPMNAVFEKIIGYAIDQNNLLIQNFIPTLK